MANLDDAIELLRMAAPFRTYAGSGGVWCGHNNEAPDANFTDGELARAVAIILNAVLKGDLVKGLPQRELRGAIVDLLENIGGHQHWDAQGTAGANCPTCIRQNEAEERARVVLRRHAL